MPNSKQSPSVAPLTERETEILALICDGYSNKEIAEKVYLTHGTVKWYASQIYEKLQVKNRTQAMAHVRELDLLPERTELPDPHKILNFPALKPVPEQRIYYTTSFDGTRIAYSIAGEGPPFVNTATFLRHLEYDWKSPVYRHWLEEFARGHTLIRYDERGTGLSDRAVEDLSYEAWVRDLEAVVEAANIEQFPLFALSQGGTVAVDYTVRHPEKVSHLILFGAYARGWLNRDLKPEQAEEERLLISSMKVGWGRDNPAFRQIFATNLIPDGPPEYIRELSNLMRISTTPENAARLETNMHHTDVRHIAPQVKVPTLVLHSIDDQGVPFEEGQLLASLIPGAEFVPLESKNHLLREDEPAWTKLVQTMRRFLKE